MYVFSYAIQFCTQWQRGTHTATKNKQVLYWNQKHFLFAQRIVFFDKIFAANETRKKNSNKKTNKTKNQQNKICL